MPDDTPQRLPIKPFALNLAAGFLLITAAVLFANATNLQGHAQTDFGGDKVEGTAEALESGAYRLRYRRGDVIHTRYYRGGFGFQEAPDEPGEVAEVTLAVDPSEPSSFLPKTVSYAPALFALALFLLGAVFLGRARRHIPRRRFPRPARGKD